jgi:hypothetical protein
MIFKQMSPVFEGQNMWGAISSGFTFIITKDGDKYSASAKKGGAGNRIDLGGFGFHHNLEEAKNACEEYRKSQQQ